MRRWYFGLIFFLPVLLWGVWQLPKPALGSAAPTLSLSSASGLPGERVTIQLAGDQLSTLRGLYLVFTYDDNALYPAYCAPLTITEGWELTCREDNGQLRLAMVGQLPVSASNGPLAEVVFQISYHTAGNQVLPLDVTEFSMFDTNGAPLTATASDGQITIPGPDLLWKVYLPLCVR